MHRQPISLLHLALDTRPALCGVVDLDAAADGGLPPEGREAGEIAGQRPIKKRKRGVGDLAAVERVERSRACQQRS